MADMVDQFLGWLVIFAPFVLSAVFILIPAKAENQTAHMRWRWALLVFGIIFSVAAWWQQSLAAKAARESTADAISKTSERVTAEVERKDQAIIDAQNKKIDALQASLDNQGKDVKQIGQSPFVSGRKPVQVEVTNPSTNPPQSQAPIHLGHLTVSQKPDISTRADAPFKTTVTVQSDIDFPSLKLAIQCDGPLVDGGGGPTGTYQMTNRYIVTAHPNVFVFAYQAGSPPFGPANPINFSFWSKQPILCDKVATF
jgi:hypothetical protein